ncbi:Mpo1-like protein [Hahella sp. SMD15-11]|uniref:Mpo1-like protein n=1 Tax=Thermohahella caldifontis TaxID=3142973 RepID=A0AB39UUV7_9GAMM
MTWTAQEWMDAYGESHQNPVNKTIHWIAVPTIFTTVVGLLWAIPVPGFMAGIPGLNWATLAMALTALWYLRLSRTLALGMILFMVADVVLVAWYDSLNHWPVWQMSLVLFVVMWILQFIGHAVEGKRPSFFKDLQFLLIGPAWLMHFIYRKLGIPL